MEFIVGPVLVIVLICLPIMSTILLLSVWLIKFNDKKNIVKLHLNDPTIKFVSYYFPILCSFIPVILSKWFLIGPIILVILTIVFIIKIEDKKLSLIYAVSYHIILCLYACVLTYLLLNEIYFKEFAVLTGLHALHQFLLTISWLSNSSVLKEPKKEKQCDI